LLYENLFPMKLICLLLTVNGANNSSQVHRDCPQPQIPAAILLREGTKNPQAYPWPTSQKCSLYPRSAGDAKTGPHGHVEAILLAIRKLGLDSMISAQRCRVRNLARPRSSNVDPCSKLATTCQWHSTTLAEELGVNEATEDELYQAMDWLLHGLALATTGGALRKNSPRATSARAVWCSPRPDPA
jgi:hypothetical protein